ncbi:endonuclease NucS domain-containing protein [Anatilimnocola aggregata]|nr:endonuclease NucS domain-containing protein [Anatilimnocola aggregata]
MVQEAVEKLGSPTTNKAIRDYILAKYGEVNEKTIACQIIICSVNHPSRVHYPENKRPRICNSRYDFLFRTGTGEVTRFDATIHGQWEMRLNAFGKLEVGQAISGPPDDPENDDDPTDEAGLPFALECHLRDFLEKNISIIKVDNSPLKIFRDHEGNAGIEYDTDVGRIDILAIDSANNLVVIELKVSRGSDRVIGQILRYMGWVKKHLAGERKVAGIIVACNIDDKLRYAASLLTDVMLFEYQLKFDLDRVALK